MKKLRWVLGGTTLASLLVVAVSFSCSSDNPAEPPDAGTKDAKVDAKIDAGPDVDDAAPPGASLSVKVVDFYANNAPVASAEVCVLDHPEVTCLTTDPSGSVDFANLPFGELTIGIKKAGYQSFADPIDTQKPIVGTIAFPIGKTTDFAANRPDGSAYDGGGAQIVSVDLSKTDAGAGPYALSISPQSGTAETAGVLRMIVGVTPGDVEVTSTAFADAGVISCTNGFPFAWNSPNGKTHYRARAYDGYATGLNVVCK